MLVQPTPCIKKWDSLSSVHGHGGANYAKKLPTVWTGGTEWKAEWREGLRTQQIFVTLTVEAGQRFEVGPHNLGIDFWQNFTYFNNKGKRMICVQYYILKV